ncbi:TetR/AcrR family transcriptional regulator [Bdellovibrio sp. HCB274]|uniref:TetR/AcrR family transcriptional regulator n=1 Tax=Bdellovibrio sp. HCB274 TaxID=3394361 RepID=UPI0039B44BBF
METKKLALEAAKNHLQLRGYNGFSFQDIADELGIRKASLHYYFASKEDLGLALIEDYSQAFQDWLKKYEDHHALERIKKFIDMYYSFSQDGLKVCPGGVLCIDFNTLPPKLKKAVVEFQSGQQEWLTEQFKTGCKQGSLKKDIKPKETALLLMSTCQGALQIARMQNNPKIMKAACTSLLQYLEK